MKSAQEARPRSGLRLLCLSDGTGAAASLLRSIDVLGGALQQAVVAARSAVKSLRNLVVWPKLQHIFTTERWTHRSDYGRIEQTVVSAGVERSA